MTMNRWHSLALLVAFLLATQAVWGQKRGQERIDSLQASLGSKQPDTARAKLLLAIAREYVMVRQYEPAIRHGEQALALAAQYDDQSNMAYAHNALGAAHYHAGDYANAARHHEQAVKIREAIGERENLGRSYHNLAESYRRQKRLSQALPYYFAALKLYEDDADENNVAATHINISTIYHSLGEHDKALQHLFVSEKTYRETNNSAMLAFAYNYIANAYNAQEKFEASLDYYAKALEIYEAANDRHHGAIALGNIGTLYREMGDYATALPYYQQSLRLSEAISSKGNIAKTTYNMGALYLQMKQYSAAETWLTNALQLRQNMEIDVVMDNHSRLFELYKHKGDYKNALAHYEQFTAYKDSAFNEENTRKFTQAEMNYEFGKTQDSIRLANEVELAVRDASIANAHRQRWFFLGGLFALASIGGLLYYQGRQRQKHNEKLRQLNAELDTANKTKLRFFSILNHDLRRPVANLVHFLHLKKDQTGLLDEDSKDRLEEQTMAGVENLLGNMEDLLLWSKGQMENFSPQAAEVRVQELFDSTRKDFADEAGQTRFVFENQEDLRLNTDKHYLETIIRNLTSNAVKALQQTENARIVWRATKADGHAVLSIADNGPGADSEKFRALYDDKEVVGIKTGLGLHLIRDLAKAIGCVIEVDSEKGKGTTIRLLIR